MHRICRYLGTGNLKQTSRLSTARPIDNDYRMSHSFAEPHAPVIRSSDDATYGETSNPHTGNGERGGKTTETSSAQASQVVYVIYISAAAILGACLRAYMARFFGGDCEDGSINDFMTPVSKHICLTSGGRAIQTGGALFRDMPANMLGSFIMGLVSSKVIRIPWLRKDHPLQKDDVYHVMISTGFCGSLTTFASWNSQMVAMMVGSSGMIYVSTIR